MNDAGQVLRDFAPTREFFVGIDSDGCVFDTMEIKHKECFTPMFIKHFGLQAVARFARETWEFVNLYSRTRGINRYPALSNALNLLADRPEVQARGVAVPSSDELDAWMVRAPRHTLSSLQAEAEQSGDPDLTRILHWSLAVDTQIEEIVHGIPPFPGVHEVLDRLAGRADAGVISQTPAGTLDREWTEHGIRGQVAFVAGQEMGTKKDQLRLATQHKYHPSKVLMIGDAHADFTAAKSSNALFFPILPGHEEASWNRLLSEGLEAFFAGSFAGDYENGLVREFQALLPETPAW